MRFPLGPCWCVWAIHSSQGSRPTAPAWPSRCWRGWEAATPDRDAQSLPILQNCLPLMISEDVHVRDAEHGVSAVLLRSSRLAAVCERGPEAAAEAAAKLRWPGREIQRKEAPHCRCRLFCFSRLLLVRFFKEVGVKVGNSISLWVAQKSSRLEFFQNTRPDTPVFASKKRPDTCL